MTIIKLICPHCKKEFPDRYWAYSGKPGGYATVAHRGIAKANFYRHVKACEKKNAK